MNYIILMFFLLSCPIFSFGEGGDFEGNGGDIAYLKNGKKLLADIFIESKNYNSIKKIDAFKSQDYQKTFNIFTELGRIVDTYGLLGENKPQTLKSSYFMKNILRNKEANIVFTEKLPHIYNHKGQDVCHVPIKYEGDSIVKIVRAGCTFRNISWILKKEFDSLSSLEKALFLIHERLHNISPRIEPDKLRIFNFIKSLKNIYISLQEQLNDKQGMLMINLREAILDIQGHLVHWSLADKKVINEFHLTQTGGLIHQASTVDRSALLGIGVIVSKGSIIESGVVLKNTNICALRESPCHLRRDSVVVNSFILKDYQLVKHCDERNYKRARRNQNRSKFDCYAFVGFQKVSYTNNLFYLGSEVYIKDSVIKASGVQIQSKSRVISSKIDLKLHLSFSEFSSERKLTGGFMFIGKSTYIKNSYLSGSVLFMNEYSMIENSSISNFANLKLSEGASFSEGNVFTNDLHINVSKNISVEGLRLNLRGFQQKKPRYFLGDLPLTPTKDLSLRESVRRVHFMADINLWKKQLCTNHSKIKDFFIKRFMRSVWNLNVRTIEDLKRNCVE